MENIKKVLDKVRNKKVIALLISIGVVVTILVNSTYSLLYGEYTTAGEGYSTGSLAITSSTTNNSVKLSNSLPMTDAAGASSTAYTFKITNTGEVAFKFDVKLLSTTSSNQISPQYIKIKINNEAITTLANLIDGVILRDITLGAGTFTNVTLRVWLDINTPNSEIGKTFNAKIVTDAQTISYGNNDIALDISGNQKHGQISGATFTGEGLSFDGTDDYMMLPSNIGATFPATYSIRFKLNNTSTTQILFGDYSSSAALGIYNNTLVVSMKTHTYTYPASGISAGKFYTVDIVYNSFTSISVYLNGTALTANTSQDRWNWPDTNSYMGKRSSGSYLNGVIERFMVYNSALTATQIANNYKINNSVVGTNGILYNNLLLYYNFKESGNFDNTAVDISGNQKNATIYGATFNSDGLSFDGVDDYVLLPSNIGATFPATYSIKFKLGSTGNQILFGDYSTQAAFGIYNGNFIVSMITNTNTFPASGLSTNTTYTVDIVYNSLTSITFYFNGTALTANSAVNQWSWPDTNSYMGKRSSGMQFNGNIERFMVYDSALTADQVSSNRSANNPDSILKDDLKLYYNFKYRNNIDVANDLSGNDRDGVINGATFTYDGLSFDGIDDYIILPDSLGATFPATYSIKFKTNSEDMQILFGDYDTYAGLGLYSSNSMFIANLIDTSPIFPTGGITLDTFYTVDIVYTSATNKKLYLNGTEVTASTTNNYWGWTDSENYIGRRAAGQYFKGTIERFMVYNAALTAAQVSSNYSVTSADIGTGGILSNNLTLYYNFKSK